MSPELTERLARRDLRARVQGARRSVRPHLHRLRRRGRRDVGLERRNVRLTHLSAPTSRPTRTSSTRVASAIAARARNKLSPLRGNDSLKFPRFFSEPTVPASNGGPMQQRRVLQRWRGGAHGTSVLLRRRRSPRCNGNIGANGGSGQVSASARPSYGPTGLHRLSRIEYDNTLRRSARRHVARRVRGAARGRQRSVRQRLLHAARVGRADRVRRDAGGRAPRRASSPTPRKRNALVGCTPVGRRRSGLPGELRARVRAARVPAAAHRRRGRRVPRAVGVRRRGQRLLRRRRARCCARCCRIRASSTASRSARRSRARTASTRSTTTRSARGCRISSGARRRRIACSTWRPRARCRPSPGAARAATELLADPRGAERVKQFHAFWLAYDQLPLDAPTWRARCAPRPTRWSRAWCSSDAATTSICSTRRRRSSTTCSPRTTG